MNLRITYAHEKYFRGFHQALAEVAQERIFIEMIEAPSFEIVSGFQMRLISRNAPVYYALDGERVVGWCDVLARENPRQNHRGELGMGLVKDYRRRGLGAQLLTAALAHAKDYRIEKVELSVYTSNLPAIHLYKKFGFKVEGLIEKFRKLDGQYFDCFLMAKFLDPR